MLRVTSIFRAETLSRRKTTLLFLAMLTASFLTTADGLQPSQHRPWQVAHWYWQRMIPYQYMRSFRNVAISTHLNQYDFAWYQRLVGQFFFHRQQLGLRGVQIADWYRTEITITCNDELPPIILAAAIANQGNSPTRPFDSNLIEQVQVWLGKTFDWPFALGRANWEDKFESPSIGIAQIMPIEARSYDVWQLFDDKTSIDLMFAKLQRASHAAGNLRLSRNDWFALTLLGNNFGEAAVSSYQGYLQSISSAPLRMKQYLRSGPENQKQLARMLAYVQFLADHEGWTLPKDIDMGYLWSLVE